MSQRPHQLITKVEELEQELRTTGYWKKEVPEWVGKYDNKTDPRDVDYAQWWQYVFIPNYLNYDKFKTPVSKISIVPQALKYFEEGIKKGKLLQIMIEIDAIV